MRKLVRPKDKVFGGVCAGVADYFKWDVRMLRLVWVVLSIVCMWVCISCSVVSYSLQPMNCSPPDASVHGILQARISFLPYR